jgi:hypothetical protein
VIKTIHMPIRTYSEANQRGHWRIGYTRKKKQQGATTVYLQIAKCPQQKPKRIRFTRQAKQRLDPDNLAGSNKHVQDAVCAYLGCDDGDESIRFEYEQEKSKEYGVIVEIEFEQEQA